MWKKPLGNTGRSSCCPRWRAFIIGFIIPFVQGIYLSFCKFTDGERRHLHGPFKLHQGLAGHAPSRTSFWYHGALSPWSPRWPSTCSPSPWPCCSPEGIRGTNVFRTVFFMPNLIGGIVLGYIWQILFNCVLSLLEQAPADSGRHRTASGAWSS